MSRLARRWSAGRLHAPLAAAAMLAIAAATAFWFPLSRLWSPWAYEISGHVRAERAAIAVVPAGVTVESTLSTLAALAARDTAFWVGSSGDPAPSYIVFDGADSGYHPAPTDIPAFVSQLHGGAAYRKIFQGGNVYVFRLAGRTGG